MVCIVGPCSIHDVKMAEDYAEKLKEISEEFKNELLVIMRVYFEKPRTTVGWKGLINDPDLNGTFNINKGLKTSRQLLLNLLKKEIGAATEWLDIMTPSYIDDVICWGAIGARTSESQVHRQLVSGLKMPVGFKNSTSGDATVAANAILSASNSHTFMSISQKGMVSMRKSKGNPNCHTILRGGSSGPNFDKASIKKVIQDIKSKEIEPYLIIDCSHGNSGKDHTKQQSVCESVAEQVAEGNSSIVGVMIESHIKEGNQKLCMNDLSTLEYGKSITDSCVNIATTRQMLRTVSDAVKKRRERNKKHII
jgi:3-deoxy-7-phosphoheptulonate synthase